MSENIDDSGKMINPHNPDFITKVPWYLGDHGPTLKHHNLQKHDHVLSLTETENLISKKILTQNEIVKNSVKTTYRKGACKNCGALTHKEKDCFERPRSLKNSAWKTGLDIAPDEVILNIENHGKLSYSAKRDYWKGYDPNDHQEIVDRYDRIESERKKLKLENDENQKISDSDSEVESNQTFLKDNQKEFLSNDNEIRDFQGTTAPQGGIGGPGMRGTVRNLRIREDTPKYLRNLNLDSAFYDPKSRSMRGNPYPNADPNEVTFAGDNFARYSGDAIKLAQNQVLCWEMQNRGENIDVISNPSQAELFQKQITEKRNQMKENQKHSILSKYDDGQSNKALDPRLLLGQTESYVEYNREGRLITSNNIANNARTKYDEDVLINNHRSVWGSFYDRSQASWGYECCHSLLKNSYCVGQKGISKI